MIRNTPNHSESNEFALGLTDFSESFDRRDSESGGQDQLTQAANRPTVDRQANQGVIEAVETNTQLLHQLLQQFSCLQEAIGANECPIGSDSESPHVPSSDVDAESAQLRDRIEELNIQVTELEQQNSDLAAQVANSNVQQVVAANDSDANETLSWEDRKQLILEQMESDTFSAEAFVADLQRESAVETVDAAECPLEFVKRLSHELERLAAELASRDDEVHELRCLLDSQSETREDGLAVGAAAIAGLIDEDELVVQERERLQILQENWEEKFRQGEIQASLERAKLSRERQEIAKLKAELEEELEHVRRESRFSQENGSQTSRKWLAKLGLNEDRG